MEPASSLCPVSFRQNPRNGQQQVFDRIAQSKDKYLNVQLPTGYGKTFVACGVYSILKSQGRVNRLFMIFPSDGQLEQFKEGGPGDLEKASVDGELSVIDMRYFQTKALRRHRMNENQVFVTTVQSLITAGGMDLVGELFSSGGRWMLCVDEYHHYGVDAAWGKAALALPAEFTLAMSATPKRKNDDSAFGEPDVVVPYRKAVAEKAVKRLIGHAYHYCIDMIDAGGEVKTVSTAELVDMVGSHSPDKIQAFMITRTMRWSPKYISPLVSLPLERMVRERIATGFKLQAIIGAMSVSHAEMICNQVKSMFGDVLEVDWVGTGEYGRSPDKNRQILKRFCPPKDPATGRRVPSLDVLVHVGMAGEGLDSVLVSEVIHLNNASWNNSNDQENGRAARYLPDVTGNINFDACSEYAIKGYIGEAIMDAMDNEPPGKQSEDGDQPPDREIKELPEEPKIHIQNMELLHVDSGSSEVVRMKRVLVQSIKEYSVKDLDDPDSSIHEHAAREWKKMMHEEAKRLNPESIARQWHESVKEATSHVTGVVIKAITRMARPERTLPGDIKTRINQRKKRDLGPVSQGCDIEVYRKHYTWLKDLETAVLHGDGVPQWLL